MSRVVVNVGDLLEIRGRLYDAVPTRQGGGTLEPAITMSVEGILAAHGERALTGDEFEAHFGDVPSDGEGWPLVDPKGPAATQRSDRSVGRERTFA
jgi:hypothetical protein